MEKYPDFDQEYVEFIEEVTFNQLLSLNKGMLK